MPFMKNPLHSTPTPAPTSELRSSRRQEAHSNGWEDKSLLTSAATGWGRAGLFGALGLALLLAAGVAQGQTFTTIKSFGILSNVSGLNPRAPLVEGPDGTLYGTAQAEGSVAGTIFKLNSDGTGFAVLKLFTNSLDGANPQAGLIPTTLIQ